MENETEGQPTKHMPLRAYWDLLARHIAPQRGRFALLVALLLISIGLQVVNPQIVRSFIDAAQLGDTAARLGQAAAAFVIIALVQQAIGIGATYVGENVAWSATNALRAELAWHCLNLDMGFHHEHSPGELIERIDGDVAQLSTFFSRLVVAIGGNVLLMAGIVGALFLEDWRIGVAFSVFAALALVLLIRLRDIAVPQQKALRQANADLFGFIEEQLTSTEDVRACGAVGYAIRRLYEFQRAILGHDLQVNRKNLLIWSASGALTALGEVLALLSGYVGYRAGAITIGTVYLLVNYMALLGTRKACRRPVPLFSAWASCAKFAAALSTGPAPTCLRDRWR